jgi:uncharacterized membrane protein YeaQ/YmgE (transglycosylase-associated protein family)
MWVNYKLDKIKFMGILTWIIVGGAAGWIGSIVMGNDGQQGILGNIVVGAIGAFIGGWIMSFLNGTGMTMGFDIRSLAVATVGAIVLLFVKNKLLG